MEEGGKHMGGNHKVVASLAPPLDQKYLKLSVNKALPVVFIPKLLF